MSLASGDKQRLITDPVLSLPKGKGKLIVYCDSFRMCVGCVLIQEGESDINRFEAAQGARVVLPHT